DIGGGGGGAWGARRRYALFTLVGIAGEDDLDAPDLCEGPPSLLPSAVDRSFKPKQRLAMDMAVVAGGANPSPSALRNRSRCAKSCWRGEATSRRLVSPRLGHEGGRPPKTASPQPMPSS